MLTAIYTTAIVKATQCLAFLAVVTAGGRRNLMVHCAGSLELTSRSLCLAHNKSSPELSVFSLNTSWCQVSSKANIAGLF
ncbi:hypothetical protein F4805DRAFT_431467 [Annulohypoxylon moriforme]|nr:hypothetical protein F4805DRAFT_431467 [Annulohypoxylon moriforme]